MKNILQTAREDRSAEIERMMQANNMNNANMQQMMQMLVQMGMTGMQTAASVNATANRQKEGYQAELIDVYKQQAGQAHTDAHKENDRMLQGMQTTVRAVAGLKDTKNLQNNHRKENDDLIADADHKQKCPSCGAVLEDGASFCEDCGASV